MDSNDVKSGEMMKSQVKERSRQREKEKECGRIEQCCVEQGRKDSSIGLIYLQWHGWGVLFGGVCGCRGAEGVL
jgi:hypothetical protein